MAREKTAAYYVGKVEKTLLSQGFEVTQGDAVDDVIEAMTEKLKEIS